jgi:hypothetical protein
MSKSKSKSNGKQTGSVKTPPKQKEAALDSQQKADSTASSAATEDYTLQNEALLAKYPSLTAEDLVPTQGEERASLLGRLAEKLQVPVEELTQ